jgi:hypothetical protein
MQIDKCTWKKETKEQSLDRKIFQNWKIRQAELPGGTGGSTARAVVPVVRTGTTGCTTAAQFRPGFKAMASASTPKIRF